VLDKYETTNIWRIDPTFDRVHSAVFPIELCNRVVRFYSFVGDLIFDPFAGSGTLGRAAANLDRNFFLTEKEAKYINRIKEELYKDDNLFSSKNNQPRFLDIKTFNSIIKRKNMTITEQVAKNIIKKLLRGEDYRIEVVTLINAEFLQFAIDFSKRLLMQNLKIKT